MRPIVRVLIVTDDGVSALGAPQRIADNLRRYDIESEIFDGVHVEPTDDSMNKAVEYARVQGEWDGFVAVGGGSAIDTAKAINLLTSHPGELMDYINKPIGKAKAPKGQLKPFIAIPTTAGTGSEVGRSSVISDDLTHIKKIIFSPRLLARAVFADPELTLDLPAHITAATGMDALTHNVESYLSPAYHPLCDGIALEGARIAARSLRTAVRQPHDIAARSDMMMSSMMGAIAFQKDLGAVHSCAHALSTVADLHHGLANGIMIDHVMRFNMPSAIGKMAELAHVVGAAVPGTLPEASAEAFVGWLGKLKVDLAIPATLSAYGGKRAVTQADIEALADVAIDDICHQTNPRPCTREDFQRIFAEAM